MASRCEWLSLLANGSASRDLGLKILQVQGMGAELTLGLGQASRLGPTGPGPYMPGSVAPSLPWVLMHLCTLPLHFHHFDDVILASKMEVSLDEVWSFTLQSSGIFLCNTPVLATIGSDFIKLMNANKTP
jgi:hypothetical protein